jgi:hypothetical protein
LTVGSAAKTGDDRAKKAAKKKKLKRVMTPPH